MKLLNTLSGHKEELQRPTKGPIKLFVCGPTVYDVAHIGHARTYIAFDALTRFLRSENFKVFYLQNITDVDDRIIDRARRDHITPEKLASQNEREYKKVMKRIGVISVTKYANASKYIPEIVKQIQTLVARGHAYEIKGNGYYFNIASFPDYGKLSKRTVAQAEDSVTRIDEGIQKKNRGDFALWKFVDVNQKNSKKKFVLENGEPAWNTKLGFGRPGWHIEDTAITESFFGPQYDIHGGGEDLKFPHHEAEIAQQEAASGKKPFVKIWLHTGFIRVRGEKMSKSLNNFVTIDDFLKMHSADTLRWLVLSHHYRSPIDFNEDVVRDAEKSLDTLKSFIEKLAFTVKHSKNIKKHITDIALRADATQAEFVNALRDDFNTPEAIATLFSFANTINPTLLGMNPRDAKTAQKPLLYALKLFGISIKTTAVPSKITKLVKARELSRTHKQFTKSDDLRKAITELGYSIDDTPLGPFVRRVWQ
ncbi:MAG: cysteine--tRNA ligase [Patescibacteria group bacterium]